MHDVEALRQLETEYLRAETEGSPALASKVLAGDFVGIRGDGGSNTKADVLQSLTRRSPPIGIRETNMREYLFGDTACVTYTKIYTAPGKAQSYSENLLHVFTKRNGVWRLQLSSPIPEPKHSSAAKP